jgi:type IV pilus assembly protein PilC
MPQYRYQARHPSGQIRAGILAADSATTAAAILRKQGHHLLQLVPVQAGQAQWANKVKALNYSSGPTQKDILDFTTQLAVMIRAGISLRVALEGIADQVANPKFKRILLAIKLDVESGKQFSGAIMKYPKLFGPLSFAAMLDRIAGYISQQLETRKMVIGASIYPGIIACMAVGVTVFLLTFVLPRFARVFEGKESVLPWPTLFLMGLSDWMVHNWWILLGLVGAGIVGFLVFIRTDMGRQPRAAHDGRAAQRRRAHARHDRHHRRYLGQPALQEDVAAGLRSGQAG